MSYMVTFSDIAPNPRKHLGLLPLLKQGLSSQNKLLIFLKYLRKNNYAVPQIDYFSQGNQIGDTARKEIKGS